MNQALNLAAAAGVSLIISCYLTEETCDSKQIAFQWDFFFFFSFLAKRNKGLIKMTHTGFEFSTCSSIFLVQVNPVTR